MMILLSLLTSLSSFAAEPVFSYLVPGIATSPDGREQIGVFKEGDDYNCYVIEIGGVPRIVSEKLPVCPGEAVDPRGYGLDQVVWSKARGEDSLMPKASRFLAVDHMYRKDNTVTFLRRGEDGIFRNLPFSSEVYSKRELVLPLIQAALKKRGYKVKDDAISKEIGGFQLMEPIFNPGDKAVPVGSAFDLEYGMLGQARYTFSAAIGGDNYVEIDVNTDVSLEFKTGELVAKILNQSAEIQK